MKLNNLVATLALVFMAVCLCCSAKAQDTQAWEMKVNAYNKDGKVLSAVYYHYPCRITAMENQVIAEVASISRDEPAAYQRFTIFLTPEGQVKKAEWPGSPLSPERLFPFVTPVPGGRGAVQLWYVNPDGTPRTPPSPTALDSLGYLAIVEGRATGQQPSELGFYLIRQPGPDLFTLKCAALASQLPAEAQAVFYGHYGFGTPPPPKPKPVAPPVNNNKGKNKK